MMILILLAGLVFFPVTEGQHFPENRMLKEKGKILLYGNQDNIYEVQFDFDVEGKDDFKEMEDMIETECENYGLFGEVRAQRNRRHPIIAAFNLIRTVGIFAGRTVVKGAGVGLRISSQIRSGTFIYPTGTKFALKYGGVAAGSAGITYKLLQKLFNAEDSKLFDYLGENGEVIADLSAAEYFRTHMGPCIRMMFSEHRLSMPLLRNSELASQIEKQLVMSEDVVVPSFRLWKIVPTRCQRKEDRTVVTATIQIPSNMRLVDAEFLTDLGIVNSGFYSYIPFESPVFHVGEEMKTVKIEDCSKFVDVYQCQSERYVDVACSPDLYKNCTPVFTSLHIEPYVHRRFRRVDVVVTGAKDYQIFGSEGQLISTVPIIPFAPIVLSVPENEYVIIAGRNVSGEGNGKSTFHVAVNHSMDPMNEEIATMNMHLADLTKRDTGLWCSLKEFIANLWRDFMHWIVIVIVLLAVALFLYVVSSCSCIGTCIRTFFCCCRQKPLGVVSIVT